MLPSLRGLVVGRVTEVFVLRKQSQVVPAQLVSPRNVHFFLGNSDLFVIRNRR